MDPSSAYAPPEPWGFGQPGRGPGRPASPEVADSQVRGDMAGPKLAAVSLLSALAMGWPYSSCMRQLPHAP